MSICDKAKLQLSGLTDRFGFNPAEVEQGSDEWKIMRLGVLTASKADKIVAGKSTDGRATYMAELISEIASCSIGDESNFRQTDWGKLCEPVARDALGAAIGFVEIKEVPLVYMNDDLRVAVSPDGVFDSTICEIKCPYDGTFHIKHIAFDKVKSEWEWQRQFQLFGSGAEKHIFCTYDPRVVLGNNLHYTETVADEAKQATLKDAVPQFIFDLDKALARIGVEFGQHWDYMKSNRSQQ